ncbi:hypothetical protein FXN61_03205 [Lentzea sp. PSKA42]|uniref:Uncharacterized protein n=1 Tax=Lentzea indica TaxID=2604800 RepID=A0ABX1FAH5_9PSEU|nr:hypothetical protein [Lentzea indica]NKE55884.1 hypothetical protein [Lentzea indica]
MSEQEIREGMLLAVWDEPPLDFDPDTLIKRVEQKKSRRRALVGVGVATAVIAVASFALPGLLPRDRGGQLASEGQTTSSTAPSEPAEKKAQRIGDKLAEKLALTMTNFKEVYAALRPNGFSYPPNLTSTAPRKPSDPELSGYVFLTDHIGPTSLRVQGMKGQFSTKDFCSSAVVCRNVQQNDGTTVIEAEFNEGGTEIARSEVVRQFPSGYYVTISSHNYNPASSSGLRQTVPVRVEVLTTLVTDPSIDWE